jgi:PIN domain nuclease of toxin-antitoxin system
VKLLLDTCSFLWFLSGDEQLSRSALKAMTAKDAELFISAASVWEMAIKSSLGRLQLPCPLQVYIQEKRENGFHILPVNWQHAAAVEHMPYHHRDPFDRLLAAQSLQEKMPLISPDHMFHKYDVRLIW